MPWVLAAAAVTVGGSLLASHNASSAANSAAQAQEQGAAAATAEQQREFDLIQNETAPGRQIGNAALGALGSSFGLPGYGNGASMTGGSAPPAVNGPQPSVPIAPAASPSMTGQPGVGLGDRAIALPAGVTMTAPKNGGPPQQVLNGQVVTPQAGGGPTVAAGATDASAGQGGPDWSQYLRNNPDLAAEASRVTSDGEFPSAEAYAAWHYQHYGQNEGRTVPMLPGAPVASDPTATPAGPVSTGATNPNGGPAPGYTDPTAPGGYMTGPRPDAGPAPTRSDIGPAPTRQTFGAAPTRPMTNPLDVSADAYHVSPGYEFQVQQAGKALDNISSASGGVFSGNRLRAASQYATGLANQDYTNWRDYTTGQYNLDRSRGDTLYGQDLGQYNLNRSRGDTLYGQDLSQYDLQQQRGDNIYGEDLGQYNLNRTRSDGLYQDDRAYTTGRYDTRNNQLMSLAGVGNASTNTSASAAQSFATNAGNNIMTGANARANGYINSANAFTSGINNIAQTGSYLAGQYMTGGGGGSSYQPPWAYGVI